MPDETLDYWRRTMEERMCRTLGGTGIVEKVYQRRGAVKGVYGVKVILDSGIVVYRDIIDVDVF